jgi:hypothetical protein
VQDALSPGKREPQTFKQIKVPTGPMIGGSFRELFGRGGSRLAD